MSTYYYDHSTWLNTVMSLDISIINHFSSLLFDGDPTRIIYASNEYALRKRASGSEYSSLDLPFANFRITEFTNDNDLAWFNHSANTTGTYVPELQRKLRYTPVLIEYEMGMWLHKFRDMIYSQSELLWDDSNQTKLTIALETSDGHTLNLLGNLGYSLNFNPTYNENDWLEQNNISTVEATLEVRTMMVKDNFNVSIPQEVVFNFLVDMGQETGTPEENYEAVVDLLGREVGEFEEV